MSSLTPFLRFLNLKCSKIYNNGNVNLQKIISRILKSKMNAFHSFYFSEFLIINLYYHFTFHLNNFLWIF